MAIDDRVTRMESELKSVQSIVCGPPTLEERLRAYIDARDNHKDNNAKQYATDLRDAFREEKEYRDIQHADNQKQFRELFKLVYIGVGILIALHALDYLIIPIMVKH